MEKLSRCIGSVSRKANTVAIGKFQPSVASRNQGKTDLQNTPVEGAEHRFAVVRVKNEPGSGAGLLSNLHPQAEESAKVRRVDGGVSSFRPFVVSAATE